MHFEVDYILLREKVTNGVLEIVKIGSSHQTIDVLTKSLVGSQHDIFLKRISMINLMLIYVTHVIQT